LRFHNPPRPHAAWSLAPGRHTVAPACRAPSPERTSGGAKILDGDAHGLEQRDLAVVISAHSLPEHQLPQFGTEMRPVDQAVFQRTQQVARLFQGRVQVVHHHTGPFHRCRRNLRILGPEGPDGIDMGARGKIFIREHRLGGMGGRANHLGLAEGLDRRAGTLDRHFQSRAHLGRKPFRRLGVEIVNHHTANRAHTTDGLQLRPGLHARAEHGHGGGVGACQQVGGQSRGCAGTDGRQTCPVHDRHMRAGLRIGQDHQGLKRRQTALGIVGKHGDTLERKHPQCGRIAGHDQVHIVVGLCLHGLARRQDDLPGRELGKGIAHRFDRRSHGQCPAHVGSREIQDRRTVHLSGQVFEGEYDAGTSTPGGALQATGIGRVG